MRVREKCLFLSLTTHMYRTPIDIYVEHMHCIMKFFVSNFNMSLVLKCSLMFSTLRTFSLFFSLIFLFSIFASISIRHYAEYTICIGAFYAISLLLCIDTLQCEANENETKRNETNEKKIGNKIEMRKLCLL